MLKRSKRDNLHTTTKVDINAEWLAFIIDDGLNLNHSFQYRYGFSSLRVEQYLCQEVLTCHDLYINHKVYEGSKMDLINNRGRTVPTNAFLLT
ncbi:MAG: hypothetical protein ACI8ZN_002706 [Bacteroidia bacterium]|jgi:hypothetical protein